VSVQLFSSLKNEGVDAARNQLSTWLSDPEPDEFEAEAEPV